MFDLQTAAEGAKTGIGIWLDAGIVTLIVTNVGLIGKELIRNRKKNGTPKPGDGASCKDHAEKLAKLGTRVEGWEKQMDEWRKENREDHQRIFDKLDGVG